MSQASILPDDQTLIPDDHLTRPKADKMTTAELTEKLHDYYRSKNGAWSFITQVRNGTGFNGITRTADAMAMGLWPSTGLDLIGFELKVSRSDWLHEVKDPTKAQEMKQFCDKWFLVVPDESIIKPGELPDDWGLMVASGRGRTIKVKKAAPDLVPVDIDRLLLASIFRNVTEKMIPLDIHRDTVNREIENGIRHCKRERDEAVEERDKTRAQIREFEQATGLTFTSWGTDHMELARVVKAAIEGRYDDAVSKMQQLRETSEKITKFIDGQIERYQI